MIFFSCTWNVSTAKYWFGSWSSFHLPGFARDGQVSLFLYFCIPLCVLFFFDSVVLFLKQYFGRELIQKHLLQLSKSWGGLRPRPAHDHLVFLPIKVVSLLLAWKRITFTSLIMFDNVFVRTCVPNELRVSLNHSNYRINRPGDADWFKTDLDFFFFFFFFFWNRVAFLFFFECQESQIPAINMVKSFSQIYLYFRDI